MEGGNLDIPPPLAQLGFNAYESTGLSLFAREGKGEKYTAITCVQQKWQQRRKWERKPRWSLSSSSAVCKSAIEVGLHRESPGGFGGVCWHFWHRSSTDLTEIRHLVDSLSGSDEQTLSKFSLIEYHFVFDRGWQPVCFYKLWYAGLLCTDLRSAGSFFPLISDILDLLWTICQTLLCKLIPKVPAAWNISHTSNISQYK